MGELLSSQVTSGALTGPRDPQAPPAATVRQGSLERGEEAEEGDIFLLCSSGRALLLKYSHSGSLHKHQQQLHTGWKMFAFIHHQGQTPTPFSACKA